MSSVKQTGSRSVDHPLNPIATDPAGASLALATVLVGIATGFFYTYEVSVTLGLAEVDDATYIETFQAINNTIRNSGFGIVFFGSLPALILALVANRRSSRVVRGLIAVGLVGYLTCLGITFAGNVPLNDELGLYNLTADGATAAAEVRAGFEDDWNRLNLMRTAAVGIGFVALAMAGMMATSARLGETGGR